MTEPAEHPARAVPPPLPRLSAVDDAREPGAQPPATAEWSLSAGERLALPSPPPQRGRGLLAVVAVVAALTGLGGAALLWTVRPSAKVVATRTAPAPEPAVAVIDAVRPPAAGIRATGGPPPPVPVETAALPAPQQPAPPAPAPAEMPAAAPLPPPPAAPIKPTILNAPAVPKPAAAAEQPKSVRAPPALPQRQAARAPNDGPPDDLRGTRPPSADSRDPVQMRAAAVGLHPQLPRELLARLSPTDLRNADIAIQTALVEAADGEAFAWPRQRWPELAAFQVRVLRSTEPGCRRYTVTVVKDGWSTTAPPMETCEAPPRIARDRRPPPPDYDRYR